MRIISGKIKNAKIPYSANIIYRPIRSIVREAIFNVLCSQYAFLFCVSNITNVLDAFAGTGSLALEALSRGAKKITLVDINPKLTALIMKFADKYHIQNDVSILNADIFKMTQHNKKYDLVFVDPPYKKNLIVDTIQHLMNLKCINKQCVFVCASFVNQDLTELVKYTNLIYEKNYSQTKITILQNKYKT